GYGFYYQSATRRMLALVPATPESNAPAPISNSSRIPHHKRVHSHFIAIPEIPARTRSTEGNELQIQNISHPAAATDPTLLNGAMIPAPPTAPAAAVQNMIPLNVPIPQGLSWSHINEDLDVSLTWQDL